MTRDRSTEEPCAVKVACTVLETSGGSDLLAEFNRALRPAVIARKVSQCSKYTRGRRHLRRSPVWCARWPGPVPIPSSKDCCTFSTLRKGLPLPPQPATRAANQLRGRYRWVHRHGHWDSTSPRKPGACTHCCGDPHTALQKPA